MESLPAKISILDGGKILEIKAVTVKDTAKYMCIARNLAGESEKTFDLDVHGEFE